MKKRLSILPIFLLASVAAFAQAKPEAAPAAEMPQFFALSVADLDESVRWYQTNFGVSTVKTINSPDGKVRVAILRSKDFVIELIQPKDSIPPAKYNPKPKDTYMVQGIFKVGFFVRNLDETVKALKARKVEFDTEIIESRELKMKFVIILDNSGNNLQLFERLDK